MTFAILSRLARVWVTLGYAAALITVSTVLLDLGPRVREQVVKQVSTNLHNLAHGNLASLFSSAFVTDAGPIYYWLPGLVCLLALAELIWRSGRLAIVFVTGHIGATLLVAMGLTAAIEFGWLPLSLSRASDVGVSYGAVAVLGALTAAIPRRWRLAWIGLVGPGRNRVGDHGLRFHQYRARRGVGAGHADRHPLSGARALDADAVYPAERFRRIRIPVVGAQRVVCAHRGHRRHVGRSGDRADHPLTHGAPAAAEGHVSSRGSQY